MISTTLSRKLLQNSSSHLLLLDKAQVTVEKPQRTACPPSNSQSMPSRKCTLTLGLGRHLVNAQTLYVGQSINASPQKTTRFQVSQRRNRQPTFFPPRIDTTPFQIAETASKMSDYDDEMDVDPPVASRDVTFSADNTAKGKRSAANLPVEAEDSLPWCVSP